MKVNQKNTESRATDVSTTNQLDELLMHSFTIIASQLSPDDAFDGEEKCS